MRMGSKGLGARVPVILAAALALSNCSSNAGDSDSDTDSDASSQSDANIDRDASVAFATSTPIAGLDPILAFSAGQHAHMSFIYDSLTQMAPDGSVAPMLAESWEFAEDGSNLTLELRDDVSFHDGTKFDAEAVKANIERAQNDPESTQAPYLSAITAVNVVDDTTVEFTLEPGLGASLPANLATFPGMMVSPTALEERPDELALDPADAGTGAYMVTDFTPGESMELERAEDPWDPEAGFVKTVSVQTIGDNTARLNGVQTGALDITQITTPTAMQQAQGLIDSGAIEGEYIDMNVAQTMFINSEDGPLADIRARQAIAAAIDKDAVCEGLFAGQCEPATQIYPLTWAHDDSLEANTVQTYDPEQAAELVEELGGLSFTLTFGAGFSTEPVAQALQAQLAEVGIDVTLQPLQYPGSDEAFINGTADALLQVAGPAADPSGTLSQWVTGGTNAGSSFTDEISEIADQANDPTLSQDERAELYYDIWGLMDENVVWIPVVAPQQLWVHQPLVADVADTTSWINTGVPTFRNIAVLKSE